MKSPRAGTTVYFSCLRGLAQRGTKGNTRRNERRWSCAKRAYGMARSESGRKILDHDSACNGQLVLLNIKREECHLHPIFKCGLYSSANLSFT
jgi:hypothetical protein